MSHLMPNTTIAEYIDLIAPCAGVVSHDDCFGWSELQKAQYMKNLTDCVTSKGLSVHLTDRYYPSALDAERKEWELLTDDKGRSYRPVPVGELDTDNCIYLNIGAIGYVSSFFTLMHLYGHRVQHEIMTKMPDTTDAKYYADITKYVSWQKPLSMDAVYQDYRLNSKKLDADYEADFLSFEQDAFAFGLGLAQESGVPVNASMQCALNTYILADFEEIKDWWQAKPNKDGEDFNKRFDMMYNSYQSNAKMLQPITQKTSPFSFFDKTNNGVVVVRKQL